MTRIEAYVTRLGGAAWRRELLALLGWDELIEMAVGRHLLRVRRGLYALPDTPADALEALRLGGRLACVSALAFHGARSAQPGEPIHVELPRSASRLRAPTNEVVLHWTRRAHPGDRLAVSEEVARAQAVACRGARRARPGELA